MLTPVLVRRDGAIGRIANFSSGLCFVEVARALHSQPLLMDEAVER